VKNVGNEVKGTAKNAWDLADKMFLRTAGTGKKTDDAAPIKPIK